MTGDEPTTQELRAAQVERSEAERAAAQDAEDGAEERTHRRRADRAAYLAEKLDEQAKALEQ